MPVQVERLMKSYSNTSIWSKRIDQIIFANVGDYDCGLWSKTVKLWEN